MSSRIGSTPKWRATERANCSVSAADSRSGIMMAATLSGPNLHFHCLPRVDDGPASWDEAVALCRAAAAEGTTRIVATPHVYRDPWINANPVVRDRLVAALNSRLGGSPLVLAGCE